MPGPFEIANTASYLATTIAAAFATALTVPAVSTPAQHSAATAMAVDVTLPTSVSTSAISATAATTPFVDNNTPADEVAWGLHEPMQGASESRTESCAPMVVDVTTEPSTQFRLSGTWSTVRKDNRVVGKSFIRATAGEGGPNMVDVTPQFTSSFWHTGGHDVLFAYRPSTSRVTNLNVHIKHATGTYYTRVDQQRLPDPNDPAAIYTSLGRFTFDAAAPRGSQGVFINDTGTDAGRRIVVDAVVFQPVCRPSPTPTTPVAAPNPTTGAFGNLDLENIVLIQDDISMGAVMENQYQAAAHDSGSSDGGSATARRTLQISLGASGMAVVFVAVLSALLVSRQRRHARNLDTRRHVFETFTAFDLGVIDPATDAMATLDDSQNVSGLEWENEYAKLSPVQSSGTEESRGVAMGLTPAKLGQARMRDHRAQIKTWAEVGHYTDIIGEDRSATSTPINTKGTASRRAGSPGKYIGKSERVLLNELTSDAVQLAGSVPQPSTADREDDLKVWFQNAGTGMGN